MTYGKLLQMLKELSSEELNKEIAFYSDHYETLQEFRVGYGEGYEETLSGFYNKGKEPKLVFKG